MGKDIMEQHIAIERVDDVSEASRVRHYDELGETAKERFPAFADRDGDQIRVDRSVAAEFDECELVKYTGYYRVCLE